MAENLDKFEMEAQLELERQFFGQDMYKFNFKLPIFTLSNAPEEAFYKSKFMIHLKLIIDTIDLTGQEIAMLFAECYKLYDIEEKPNGMKGQQIANFCKVALGQIALAKEQANSLYNLLNETEKYDITGQEYCFISMFLNNIFVYYTTIFNSIFVKNYLSNETLDIMKDRINFILTPEFQILKVLFKTSECFEVLDQDQTIH